MGFGPTVFVKSLSLASDHLLPRGDFAGIMGGWELELLPDTWLGSLGALVFSLGLALTRSALTLGGSRESVVEDHSHTPLVRTRS